MSSYSDPTHRLLEQIAVALNRQTDALDRQVAATIKLTEQQRVANLIKVAQHQRVWEDPFEVLFNTEEDLEYQIRAGLGFEGTIPAGLVEEDEVQLDAN